MKQHEIKTKLKVLSVQGIGMVVTDLLKILDTNASGDETDEDYARLAKTVIAEMRQKYKNQIKGQEVALHQRTLEEVIDEIKAEEQLKQQKDEV